MAELEELSQRIAQSRVLDDDDDDDCEPSMLARVVGGPPPAEVATPREMSGFMYKKSGAFSANKRRFFVLQAGTLFWYKTEKDDSPAGCCHLRDVQLIEGEVTSKYAEFTVRPAGVRAKDYILQADDERERASWLRALRHNSSFPPISGMPGTDFAESLSRQLQCIKEGGSNITDSSVEEASTAKAEVKAAKKSMLSSLALRAEKRMVGRAVTSDIGKKLLREYCLPETFILLEALRELASKDPSLPPRYGQQIENTILKTAVKVALLYQHSMLGPRDFDIVIPLVDEMCIAIVRKYDVTRKKPHMDLLDPEHRQVTEMMEQLQAELEHVLSEHLSEKNMQLLRNVTTYFGDSHTLRRITQDSILQEDFGKIAQSLRTMYRL